MSKLDTLKYYQPYHKHTSMSHRYNKDSPLMNTDYYKFMIENFKDAPKVFTTVEHGWQSTYFDTYNQIEDINKHFNDKIVKDKPNKFYSPGCKPFKFIFGTEAYWVKDRHSQDASNCHIVLLAKNDNGRKKLNRAIYESYASGYYYKNRMDLEILLSLPKDDVFVTSACLAFWHSYSIAPDMFPFDNNTNETGGVDYSEIDEIVLKLYNHFTDFYLEVQANNTDKQKEINKHILELHYKYGIPLIAGTDTHVIYEKQLEDRDDLLRSNHISYPEETGWFMDLPTLKVFIERFQKQGILNDDEIYEAINNTNRILYFEDIILDRSLKVPVAKKYQHLSLKERNEIFENILREEWKRQVGDINNEKFSQYIEEIKHDIEEIEGCHMADYFIDNYEIMNLGIKKYGGILTPSGRGSGVSMFLNKLFGFTKVDKVNSPVLMYSERFLTKERVLDSKTPPDIDHNVSDRNPFIQAQKDIIGEEGTFDLIALGTLKYKSAFKMYARAYNLDPQLANDVTKQITKYEKAMQYAEDDEKDLIDIYDYIDKDKYEYLIEGCQQYKGIVDNLKSHPCGCLCYSGDAIEDIGVIMVKSESTKRECFVAVIESGTIDSFGYLKQDYLIVDSIGLTYEIYDEIGMEPMSVNQLLEAIDGDEKTWNIYANGHTMCINQCEQPKSTQKIMKYKPNNIAELTQWIAGIRPSFKSMYKTFENRELFDYGVMAFDNLIQDEYCPSSFILYQEQLMKVLSFAGFEIGETYTVIKAISKKKQYVIDGSKNSFIPNFAQAILDTNETNDVEEAHRLAEKVWKIVEDSAAYGFNSAHAYCMAIDSVTLAWQKAHYPLQFYKVCLQRYTNKGNKDKVTLLKKEMLEKGIQLKPIRFGDDNRTFSIDYENSAINQTMASVKNMQELAPSFLYELRDNYYSNIHFIFKDLLSGVLNKKSIDILIKLDYFKEYGEINRILIELEAYKKTASVIQRFETCKQLNKAECEKYGLDLEEVAKYSGNITPKTFKDIDNEGLSLYVKKQYKTFMNRFRDEYTYIPATTLDRVSYQVELMGYSDIVDDTIDEDTYALVDIEMNGYGTPFFTLYRPYDGETIYRKVDRNWFYDYPLTKEGKSPDFGKILRCAFKMKNKRMPLYDKDNQPVLDKRGRQKWGNTGEVEEILNVYKIEN
jgi:DNA polymerase III alpha subunit